MATDERSQAQAADYRDRARWRKATYMVAALLRFPVRPEPHELLLYGDHEWLALQQHACPWKADDTDPPSDTTRLLTSAEYLRQYHQRRTDTTSPCDGLEEHDR